MADAKSLLESIARSFGYIYGREKKVRINTISQSPTFTTAGSGIKGFDGLYDFSDRMSPLGNASADECADYCVVMFSDLTKKVTMRDGRDVESLVKESIVEIVVSALLAHVDAHGTRVEHEIDLAAQSLLSLYKQVVQILYRCRISWDDSSASLLGKLVDCSHAASHRCVGQYDLSTFLYGTFCYFPRNRCVVQCAEDDTALSFQ